MKDNKISVTNKDKKNVEKIMNDLHKNDRTNFDKIARDAIKGVIFKQTKKNSYTKYSTPKEYNESIGEDIITFSKKFTQKKKKEINTLIYHKKNSDGLYCCYIYWAFITDHGKKRDLDDILIIQLDPGYTQRGEIFFGVKKIIEQLRGRNVMICDLSFNFETFKYIKENVKELIIIDDHPLTKNKNTTSDYDLLKDNLFVGRDHAAVAYTYKFFYPKQEVPLICQYIDSNDNKLFLPYLVHTDLFLLAFSVLYPKNIKYNTKKRTELYDGIFDDMNKAFSGGDECSFLIFIGHFMNLLRENQKFEIAALARPAKFLGYNVGVLNFNAPSLAKVVGRQILTNFRRENKPIEFSVLWGYEYSNSCYRIQCTNDHSPNAFNFEDPVFQRKIDNLNIDKKRTKGDGGKGGKKNIFNIYYYGNINDVITDVRKY